MPSPKRQLSEASHGAVNLAKRVGLRVEALPTGRVRIHLAADRSVMLDPEASAPQCLVDVAHKRVGKVTKNFKRPTEADVQAWFDARCTLTPDGYAVAGDLFRSFGDFMLRRQRVGTLWMCSRFIKSLPGVTRKNGGSVLRYRGVTLREQT